MRKFIFVFILISLIYIAFSSPCTDKKSETNNNGSTNTTNPTNITNPTNTTNTTNTTNADPTPAGDNQGTPGRRRLDLTPNDCKDLKTKDDEKYQCVLSDDKQKCEEVKKENSKILFLSLTILIFLFLF